MHPIVSSAEASQATKHIYLYAIQYEGREWTRLVRWSDRVRIIGMPTELLGEQDANFEPAQIGHGEIRHSAGMDQKSVAVNITFREKGIAKMFVTSSAHKIRIFILRYVAVRAGQVPKTINWSEVEIVESGVAGVIGLKGMTIEATVTPEPFASGQQVPRYMFTRTCNRVFGQCGVDLATIKIGTTIASASRPSRLLVLNSTASAAKLRHGRIIHTATNLSSFIEWADNNGPGGQIRLRLRTWSSDFTVNASIDAIPGCQLTVEACEGYGNQSNFGGFPFVPVVNPSTHGA